MTVDIAQVTVPPHSVRGKPGWDDETEADQQQGEGKDLARQRELTDLETSCDGRRAAANRCKHPTSAHEEVSGPKMFAQE